MVPVIPPDSITIATTTYRIRKCDASKEISVPEVTYQDLIDVQFQLEEGPDLNSLTY
jgi:hypothetical protein